MNILHGYTKDGLNLSGFHWESQNKNICVVFTHGMYDNIIENCFIETMGDYLSKNGYGLVFGHNRGYGVINSIIVKNPVTERWENKIIGSTYEKFGECIYDIDLWIDEARKLGYKKIILAAHSLGCIKNIYYTSKKGFENIEGFIFISPPDASGLARYMDNFKKMIEEAEKNIQNGESKKIMENKMLEIFPISSRTFYNFRKNGPIDVFPVIENPSDFGIFSKITKPIFVTLGERDSIIIKSPEEDLKNLEEKAVNCEEFCGKVIKGATHRYINREKELSQSVLSWLKKYFY